jgi:hypothetical protein
VGYSWFHRYQIPIRRFHFPVSLLGIDAQKYGAARSQAETGTIQFVPFSFVGWKELRPPQLFRSQGLPLLNRASEQDARGRVEDVVTLVRCCPRTSFAVFSNEGDGFSTSSQEERKSPCYQEQDVNA